jgi:hypothetical protein
MRGHVPPRKGRPTSPRQLKRAAYADFAVVFFKIWKEAKAARSINDRGHREKMKQQSCAFAVDWLGGSEADIEARSGRQASVSSKRQHRQNYPLVPA